ncbi:MAG: hypothetical protein V1724_05885 [Chloroflexota bacterium]
MTERQVRKFDYDTAEVGYEEDGGTYVLTQAQVDMYRQALDDPEAAFPQIGALPGAPESEQAPPSAIPGGINARSEREYFNPPIPGKKIHVTRRISGKYMRRDLQYVVDEKTGVDEDGRLIERFRHHSLLRGQALGEKWAS